MTPVRWPLRVGVVSVLATVAAVVLIVGYLGDRLRDYERLEVRATTEATGVVVEDRIGDEDDVVVRWTDSGERVREQQFCIYDTARYREGVAFAVRYDASSPQARAFPADPEETCGRDDLEVPIYLSGAAGSGLIAAWGARGGLYRLRRRRPTTRAKTTVLAGESRNAGPISLGLSAWLVLEAQGERTWQRVMWHPALHSLPEGTDIDVHGSLTGRRRVVAALPGGVWLVPVGRLRHRPPRTIELLDRDSSQTELDDLWIFPAGTPVPPGAPWWRRALALSLLGAAVGAGMGMAFGGGAAVLPLTLAMAAIVCNAWGLGGAEP